MNWKVTILLLAASCSSLPKRSQVLIATSAGAGVGATSGYMLSPNRESQGLNALVFGLVGALVGGIGAILFGDDHRVEREPTNTPDLNLTRSDDRNEVQVSNPESLPEFVKKRLRPVVIESYTESDSIDEDGSLREPHRVYRIKRPAELIARPSTEEPKP